MRNFGRIKTKRMGLQIKFQTEIVEFQTVLALRFPARDEEREVSELIPPDPHEGEVYEFSKSGYRLYLLEPLPLVATEGNQLFSAVIGMVEPLKISFHTVGDSVETRGIYVINKLFDKEESDRWLEILRDRGEPRFTVV